MSRSVAIVGAGFGGLAAAIELKRAGIESFTVFERADEVGGVWQANTYPGAACDVPSIIYQFSHALIWGSYCQVRVGDRGALALVLPGCVRFASRGVAAVRDD